MANNALIRKALSVATSGASISAYLPDPLAQQVIEYIRDINIMRRLLNTFTMKTRTWRKPKRTSGLEAYFIPDGVTATLSSFAATTVLWTARKLMSYVMVDEEAIEDSQPDVVAQVLEDFGQAVGEAEEKVLCTGDTDHTATAPTPDAATDDNWYVRDARLMFEGIFPTAISGGSTAVDAGSAIFDEDMINNAIYNLGKYGRNKAKLFGLAPPDQAANIRMNSQFKNASTSGQALASFITGMGSAGEKNAVITIIYGVPIYEIPQGTAGQMVLMQKGACDIGDRRKIKMKSEEVIESDQRKFVVSERIAFQYNFEDQLVSVSDLDSTVNFA